VALVASCRNAPCGLVPNTYGQATATFRQVLSWTKQAATQVAAGRVLSTSKHVTSIMCQLLSQTNLLRLDLLYVPVIGCSVGTSRGGTTAACGVVQYQAHALL
jgi:hypothetical protein